MTSPRNGCVEPSQRLHLSSSTTYTYVFLNVLMLRFFILFLILSYISFHIVYTSLSNLHYALCPLPSPAPSIMSTAPATPGLPAVLHAANTSSITSSTPLPCFTLVNTVGPSPRIIFASLLITSSDALTCGAKSIYTCVWVCERMYASG